MRSRIVALCGGVGGAKLADGLAQLLAPDELQLVVNTGDDFEHLGLPICPDLDTVTYTLAGVADDAKGWGRREETWSVLQELERLGGSTWFHLGDRDIALHLLRRELLQSGCDLTQATAHIAARLGVKHSILPMSNERVRTLVHTEAGTLEFQDYFVRLRCAPKVTGFDYAGAGSAQPSAEVQRALADEQLHGIILCPSNPYVSIAPILALLGLRARLRAARAPVIAVSPIVGGQALKGPAAKMMTELGVPVSGLSIARMYADFLAGMLLDAQDSALAGEQRADDPRLFFAPTIMRTRAERIALARECLRLVDELRTMRPR